MPVALDQRPELAHPGRVARGVNTADALPVCVLDIIAKPRLDPHHHAVPAILAAVGEPHVFDRGFADRPHPVAPALAIKVIQAPLPLGQQLRRNKSAQTDTIARVPGRLNVYEQPRRLRANTLWRKRRVVLGRLGGRKLNPPLTRSHPPARDHPGALLTLPPPQHPRQHQEHHHQNQDEQQQPATAADRDEEKMPATEPTAHATAAAAAAKARAAATSTRERVRHNQKSHQDRRRDHTHRTPRTRTDQPADPTPGEVGRDPRTAHAQHIGPGPIAAKPAYLLTRRRLTHTVKASATTTPSNRHARGVRSDRYARPDDTSGARCVIGGGLNVRVKTGKRSPAREGSRKLSDCSLVDDGRLARRI